MEHYLIFLLHIGVLAGIESPSFTVTFSLTTGIIKEVLETTINKKKKHNKIAVLPRRKLNSNETLIPQALIDLEISHEEFKAIVNQK